MSGMLFFQNVAYPHYTQLVHLKFIPMRTQVVVVLCMVLITQLTLMQCESPKKAVRQEADESGKESAWNADIRKNADEMLEKGRAVFRFDVR